MERVQERKITRNRELRACSECRRRKLRCDRQLPCNSCIRRNEGTSCVYEKKYEGLQSEHLRRVQAEARLEHLEQLVQGLSQSQETSINYNSMTPCTNTVQHDGDPNLSLYNGATHWSEMLEDIEELRAAITTQDDFDDANSDADLDSDEGDGISILFGAMKPLSFQQVVSQLLPLRQETDRLVAAYFRAKAIAAPFVHSTHFSRRYHLFWDNPSAASPLWTSILFSILDIATRTLLTGSGFSASQKGKNRRFAIAAAHCLAVGEYYKPQRFAVEALVLYIQARCITCVDVSPVLAILFGTLARLATTMGYHRDADEFREGVSAFEGEMRRRTWSICVQLDMLISFQLGLPSNIQFPTWDTKSPMNLLDSDFDEDTIQLPPVRPQSEPTELLFYIAKHKLVTVFEKIIRHTLSTTDPPNEELESIDQELRSTYAALPSAFQPRSMAESIVDSPSVIVTRLCVSFIYQKCLCVLHRKYVIRGRQKSVTICYDAASNLVRQFLDIYKEFEPGGQLETERWFIGSLSWHDFLLACTVLCTTVYSTRLYAAELTSATNVDVLGPLELLQKAQVLCEKQATRSRDTQKVRQLIEATVLKFGLQDDGASPMAQGSLHTGQDLASVTNGLAIPFSQFDNFHKSPWNESTMGLTEDSAWADMEQFLDLTDGDFITDTSS